MSDQKIPVTPAGYKRLQEELKRMKVEDRPKAIQAISEARGHGDLSENAEYDAAKEKQGILEARIRDTENRLALAQIVDPSTIVSSTITFGAKVDLLDLDTDTKITYQIVGEIEADLKVGRISISSPIGKALIGKAVGDVFEAHTPKGVRELEVLKIKYE